MKLLMIFHLLIVLILPAQAFAFSSSDTPNHLLNPNQAQVIATLTPLSGFVAMLLPDIKSQCLLPANADPHHFQPTPNQVKLLQSGQLILRASSDDKGWPIRFDHNHVLDLSRQQNHAWLQFESVKVILPTLAKALSTAFPIYQAQIKTHLAKAMQHVDKIEQKWVNVIPNLQKRGVIMQHPAWLGLFESANIPVWSVLESHQHGHEQGPRHLEHAFESLQNHPDAILLGSRHHSNRSLTWLNSHAENKHQMIALDAIGDCNQPWDELMMHNLELLAEVK